MKSGPTVDSIKMLGLMICALEEKLNAIAEKLNIIENKMHELEHILIISQQNDIVYNMNKMNMINKAINDVLISVALAIMVHFFLTSIIFV